MKDFYESCTTVVFDGDGDLPLVYSIMSRVTVVYSIISRVTVVYSIMSRVTVVYGIPSDCTCTGMYKEEKKHKKQF